MTQTPVRQSLVIEAWHPRTNPNGSHGHWRTHQKNHDIDRDMAWASARQAGWVFVPGKVRLTITLVYPRKYRIDADNLTARCKGLIDGLKSQLCVPTCGMTIPGHYHGGFFFDDDTEHLDLVVRAEVAPGQKSTRIELEAIGA